MAESENIGANHLGFVKSLFQQYSQQLGLNSNHYPAKSVFNFYVNNRITECLGGTVNIEAARKNFYTELFQYTNLPKNYSFAPIIREINQTIERYTQQQFPIIYADKSKGRIQTPAATPKEIQLPRIRSPPPQLDFGITTPWELSEEKKEEKSEDQEFTYQNPITENSEVETLNFQAQQSLNLDNLEIETPNHQRQNNPNPELSNQQNLPLVIVINQPPINPPPQQQPLQQPPQQSNLDPMAYAPITKLDNFTGKEDNAQVWLNDVEKTITANRWNDVRTLQAIPYFLKNTTDAWYQSLVVKPQNFNDFKMEFVRYFSNNNNINKLANLFTTIKQGDTEAVTTYLGHFYRNLHQIQAIQADYFTAPQILNQFIRDLHSNLLQRIRPMHPVDLPTTVTYARDFEAAELEANHAQAVNLVMNGSSELDSKLKQFRNMNHFQNQSQSLSSTAPSLPWQLEMRATQNLTSQHYLSLLVTSKDASTSNQKPTQKQQTLTSNILPATVINNKSLAVIFPFEIEELSSTPLFSGAILNEKPITTMYTDAKVDSQSIKLILNSSSTGSIITRQLMDQLGYQVD
ncbi:hypothetical protein G9A89_018459 [Geosiphon pyriformis]|nr:hypothetical protein G9A89_018459 [Geosiphon pyriformis]